MKKPMVRILMALFGITTCVGGVASGQDMSTPSTNAPTASSPANSSTPNGATQKPISTAPGVVTSPTKTTTDSSDMAPIIVTGSMIPTTAGEVGPTPVDYITNEQLTKQAGGNIFDDLKKSDPSFQGASNFGQELDNNSQSAGESQLELRNLPTLFLLDGNRLTTSPLSTGEYVNVNLIPISFIDHIEVLKDGASTLYGSDAVGGVINVITKKNFTGVEVNEQYDVGGEKGGFYSDKTSVVGGISTDTTSVFAGIEYTYNNEILTTDRPSSSYSQQQLAALGGGALPSYFSSNYPQVNGLGNEGTQIFKGNPLAAGAPGYDPGAGTTPGVILGGITLGTTTADRTAQDAELAGAGYIPVSTIPSAVNGVYRLNTTQYGTYAYTPQEREQAFANFGQDIYHDTVQFFATFLYNHGQAESNLAPQPAPLTSEGVTVPVDNPFNPFGVAIDGSNGITIKYRFLDAGDRISTQTDDYYHFVTGLKGDFGLGSGGSKDYHYSASFGYDSQESRLVNSNYINTANLQDALNGTLAADPGVFYNPFGLPQSNPKALTNAISDAEIQDGTADLMDIKVDLSATPSFLTLPGGVIGLAAGAEYRVESLGTLVDGVTSDGDQLGANATNNFNKESRTTGAFYGEASIPIVGPDMHVPGIYNLNVDASGRFEGIEDGASSTIFRVAASWQPIGDELTIRGNFSESFLAPTLYALYGPAVQTFAAVNLPGGGGEPAGSYQEAINEESGPTPNSTAQNWGIGGVYSPKWLKGLTVSADYYNVIFNAPTDGNFQAIVDSINSLGAASPYAKNANTLTPITGPNQLFDANFASLNVFPSSIDTNQKTQGIDMTFNYVLPWMQYGQFTVGATATYLLAYQAQDGPGGAFTNYAGTYSDTGNVGGGAQGLLPKWQINPYFEYQWGGFTYNLSAQYIPTVTDLGDTNASNSFNDYSADGHTFPITSYYNIDTSVSYQFGAPPLGSTGPASLSKSSAWYDTLMITFGVNNLTDHTPPFVPSSSEDNTAKGTYDIIGRLYYFQVKKDF